MNEGLTLDSKKQFCLIEDLDEEGCCKSQVQRDST